MARPPKIPYDEMPKMKFGRLKPIKIANIGKGRTTWICKCDCGKEVVVTQKNLCNGNTRSCGCLNAEVNGMRTHGLSKTRLYTMFLGIKARCYNQKNISYKWYGGKGIKICNEWLDDFKSFYDWAISNGYDESLPRGVQTLDRIDGNKDYEPSNCRWITLAEQQRNKEHLKRYSYNGETHLLCEWSEILGINFSLLRSRVCDYGWTLEEAVENKKYAKVKLKKITIDGQELSVREWSEKLGIPENRIRQRLSYYKDPKKVLEISKNNDAIKAED